MKDLSDDKNLCICHVVDKRGSFLEESIAGKIKLREHHSNNHKEDTVVNHVEWCYEKVKVFWIFTTNL